MLRGEHNLLILGRQVSMRCHVTIATLVTSSVDVPLSKEPQRLILIIKKIFGILQLQNMSIE